MWLIESELQNANNELDNTNQELANADVIIERLHGELDVTLAANQE